MKPLVTIICLCYNHAPFVRQALYSVLAQDYPHVELIVVDDASTDGSEEIINALRGEGYAFTFIQNDVNAGNCRAFNQAFELASGQYIVDFATDDLMESQRIRLQAEVFDNLDATYGVIFSDAYEINTKGQVTGTFYKRTPGLKLLQDIPSGDVYQNILRQHFICPPTMMIRREVLDDIGGYDGSLAFEDFDFWVRSSRFYNYYFQDALLTYRRKHQNSLSFSYRKGAQPLLESTYRVCLKALELNRNQEDNKALKIRARHEMRHAWFYGEYHLVLKYKELLKKLGKLNWMDSLVNWFAKRRLNFALLLKMFKKI